jgi:hypothetical protein
MTVKLVLLKSGEKLISDIKEGFIEEKLVCYLLEKPCTISVNGSYKVLDEEDGGNKVSISLHSWPAFSKQETIDIIPSWIISLVEPSDEIKEMYENEVLLINKEEKENDQSVVLDEQSDSNQSD